MVTSCVFQIIEGSGHHVYADGSEELNEVVLKACNYSDIRDRDAPN